MAVTQETPSPQALRDRVRATWSAGDFGRIAVSFEQGAAEFVGRLGLKRGERVLDVACGTGNLTLPAARTGAKASGIDIAPALVAQLAARAAAEGLAIDAREGDAETLPYADGSFDTVVTKHAARNGGVRATAAGCPVGASVG
jgi:2-polyprenyl-3-methyl-5-hydroxy-6-metoxy-1,4-benzoquinol methylase